MTLALVQDKDSPVATFADFWTLYPKRVARVDAEKAWRKLTPVEQVEALTALVRWRDVWISEGKLQFVPHGASWLNGHRFEDELPEQWAASHASHVPAKPPVMGERTEMPQSVRDAIARLRK